MVFHLCAVLLFQFAKRIQEKSAYNLFTKMLDAGVFLLPGIAMQVEDPFCFVLDMLVQKDVMVEGET
jgi:hypothetical protein